MLKLLGDLVSLRPLIKSDLPALVEWNHDPEINHYADGDFPKTIDDSRNWLDKLRSNRYKKHFAILVNNDLIGDIELDHIAWRSGDAELKVRIGKKDLWSKGYGTDAVCTLLNHAFLVMNLNRVYLRVYADNERALGCYRKAGFKKEGRLTRRSDRLSGDRRQVILMRVLKDDYLRKHKQISSAG